MSRRRGIVGAVTALFALTSGAIAAVKVGDPADAVLGAAVALLAVVAAITIALLVVMRFVVRLAPRDRTVALEVLRVLLGREGDGDESARQRGSKRGSA
jgi:hypothetical protein